MELVSKEKMLEKLAMLPADQFYNLASIRNFIKAEAEAVVRCEDCKWYKTIYSWNGKEHHVCVREANEPIRESDDYCSYAERKEE